MFMASAASTRLMLMVIGLLANSQDTAEKFVKMEVMYEGKKLQTMMKKEYS